MKKMLCIAMVLFLLLSVTIVFAAGEKEKETVKMAHFYDPMGGGGLKANYDWLQKLIADFEKANPDLKIEEELFQWDQIDVKSMSDHRAGIEDHDVFLSSPQLMAQHALVGDFADMSSFVEADWSEADLKDFSWAAPWKKAVINGEMLGIPLGAHTRTVAYNREMFEEAGLNPDRPPRNLEETVRFAQKLTRDTDGDGKNDIYGLGMFYGPSRATIELFFAPIVWDQGGKLWDPQTKRASFADQAGIKSAQFARDLIHKYKVTPAASVTGTYDEVIFRDFLDGRIAMAWGWGSYWIQPLEEKGWIKGLFPPTAGGKVGVADVALTPTGPQAQFTNAWFISIYKLSKNKDAAWKFVDTMLKPEYLWDFPDAGLPIRASLWDTPEMQTPFYKVWKEAVEKGRPMPPTAHYGELADTVAAALQEILVKDADAAETLKKAQDEYNAQYGGE